MKINVSTGFKYHTQRDNLIAPYYSCNVTALAMGLIYSRIPINWPDEIQNEDWLNELLQTEDALSVMGKLAPRAVEKLHPRDVNEMLAWVANKVAGYECDTWVTEPISGIVSQLTKGYAVVTAGKFTTYGHVICVVGLESRQNLNTPKETKDIDTDAIKYFILDDPWGNVNEMYMNKNGDNIEVSYEYFNKMVAEESNPYRKGFHKFIRKE